MMAAVGGIVLIIVPILFNVAFLALGRSFGYPAILRRPPGEVLERFAAGGSRLVLTWWFFTLTAALFVPFAGLVGVALRPYGSEALLEIATAVGVAAGVVQAIGLSRWPFAVPELARRHATGDAGQRQAVELQFDTMNCLLGVGIGEHLGYLFTGGWTLLIGADLITSGGLMTILGIVAMPIGLAQIVGSLEFVGPNEKAGWHLAGTLVAVAYIGWSLWLIALGLVLIIAPG